MTTRGPIGGRRRLVVAVALASLGTTAVVAAQERASDYTRVDPAELKMAEACGECHVNEYEVWKQTPHSRGFKTLHRLEAAEAVAAKMGFRLIKRDSLCIRCHYTPKTDDGQIRAASGVSCESCHGAGRRWIEIHNDYGIGFDFRTESAEHRAERIDRSREAGMRRPSEIYDVAANCFGCHTVPEERLVNVGGHTTGSATFELVEWSQGKIRHNFVASQTGGSRENRESSPERKRLLYATGRALDLEYSLRGMAAANDEGIYAKAMSRRVRSALAEVRALAGSGDFTELDEMVGLVRGVKVVPANGNALERVADAIGAATRRFLSAHDGTALAAFDPLLLGLPTADEESPDGEPVIAASPAAEEPLETGGGATPTRPSGASPATSSPSSSAPSQRARSRGTPAVGEVKRHLRPRSDFATLGPGSCAGCHTPQNEWWFGDRHFTAADPFFEQAPKNVKIARLYGIKPSEMTRGNRLCMDCHGTVITGKENREVLDGVGCESCHGPAKEYMEPHKQGEKDLGLDRPGYQSSLQLGLTELIDLDTRAATCAGCHYITDPRLISAGHPPGSSYDFAASVAKIKHWEDDATANALTAAYGRVLSRRGAVPTVQIASLPGGDETESGGVATGGTRAVASSALPPGSPPVAGHDEQRPARTLPHRPRPVGRAATDGAIALAPVDLPPFREIDEAATVEDLLLELKERLETLYAALPEDEDRRE